MRIAIDLTALNARASGIDRYLLGMVRSLALLDCDAEFFLFINVEDRSRFVGSHRLPAHCHVWPCCFRPRVVRLFFQQILQPLLLYALRIDVLHSPTFIMPAWRGRARHILTIHDMSSFVLPHCHPPIRRGPLYESIVSGSIRRAALVSVPSSSVKADILRFVDGVSEGRIRVIPCGIDDAFRARGPVGTARVLKRLGIPTPYVLYLGTLDPRKNLPTLLEAFGELVADGRPEQLVLGGGAGWSQGELASSIADSGLASRVHLPGYIAEADLPFVYAGAALFVYPSLLEGFGFPPLEAMASGVPVIASDTSSLRENLADAAILVPPNDSKKLAAAMRTLLSDEVARVQTIAAGLKRAQAFRWENFAIATFACYEECRTARRVST
ncbi:MAG: glycosyltransferase family 4 protein [Chthoniobacterales bacterium]